MIRQLYQVGGKSLLSFTNLCASRQGCSSCLTCHLSQTHLKSGSVWTRSPIITNRTVVYNFTPSTPGSTRIQGLCTSCVVQQADLEGTPLAKSSNQVERSSPAERSVTDPNATIQTINSLALKVDYSLEKYYKRDDVSTDAILIYKHQHLTRYQVFYTLTAIAYALDLLALNLLMPPPDVPLIQYTLEIISNHGPFYDPFTTSLVLLPVFMHVWTLALRLVRRQFRAIYFHPKLQQYIGVSYTWRWSSKRMTFDQSEVEVDKQRKHRITVRDHPFILHDDCFTSGIYRKQLCQVNEEL